MNEAGDEEFPWAEATRDSGAAAAGALLGAVLAGAPGAVVGGVSSAALEHTFRWAGERWRWRSEQNGVQVLADACAESGLTPAEIESRIEGDPKRLQLTAMALSAGMMTTDDDKLHALARSLAAGVGDDAHVDPEMLAIAALTDMEAPHIKVLRHLAAEARRDPLSERVWHRSWSAIALRRELPEVAVVLAPVLATLQRHALIEELSDLADALDKRDKERERRRNSTWKPPPTKVRVTAFGQHCLDLLERVAAEQEEQPSGDDARDTEEEPGTAAHADE